MSFHPCWKEGLQLFLIIKGHKWQRQWQRRCRQRGINWRKVGMKGKDKSMGGKEKFPFPWQIRDRVEGSREADRWRDERRKNLKKTFNKEGSRRQKWRQYVLESERNLLLSGIFRLKWKNGQGLRELVGLYNYVQESCNPQHKHTHTHIYTLCWH